MLKLAILFVVYGCVSAQTFKTCIPSSERTLCNNLDRDGSQAVCEPVESRIDCAIKLTRGTADFGVFTEEETLLLGQQRPNDNRVVATIRDVTRTEPYAFEAVAVVPSSFTGGLQALKGSNYCHPGFDNSDLRWSPRVLKELESALARSSAEQCPPNTPPGKTIEEMEVVRLADFFNSACRPGPWSYNVTIDAELKRQHPNLCALCGPTTNTTCGSYSIDMGVSVAGVRNENRHIQALECLRTNANAVSYVAWQHVREFFNVRNPEIATSYAVLCPDGTTAALTNQVLLNTTAPCAFVRQPWTTIVASTANAATVQAALRTWWPSGANPGSNWQSILFNGIVGGSNARVFFEDGLPTPSNYTSSIRVIPSIGSTQSCQPARRWCTLSTGEMEKCSWVSAAAHSLGIQPGVSCVQSSNIFECLDAVSNDRADFIASSSNYGYLARQHYKLSPVKLVQNSRLTTTRVAAFVKETSAQGNVTRFENLRGKKACFPEYGGIAYVAFVRAAHERAVIAASECDYTRAVGEFFHSACAPGALDASHSLLQETNYNASNLCSVCKPTVAPMGSFSDSICTWDYTNMYFGNNGSLACLANPETDVAFLRTTNIAAELTQLGLQASQFRALCRNNTLAANAGVEIDDSCLLAHTVDAEVITRRNDPLTNALSVLLETLDLFFGYSAESTIQLINLEIFSPFDGTSDLLFKDSAIGFTEPSAASTNEHARNYIELFRHLETCTGAAPAPPAALAMAVVVTLLARFVVY